MSAKVGTLEYWQEVAEAVTDDARKLRTELAALRADAAEAWRQVHLLKAETSGPDGFATWKDAATDERVRRVKAEAEAARLRATLLDEAEYCYGYARKYESADEGRAARHRERGDRLKRAALGER